MGGGSYTALPAPGARSLYDEDMRWYARWAFWLLVGIFLSLATLIAVAAVILGFAAWNYSVFSSASTIIYTMDSLSGNIQQSYEQAMRPFSAQERLAGVSISKEGETDNIVERLRDFVQGIGPMYQNVDALLTRANALAERGEEDFDRVNEGLRIAFGGGASALAASIARPKPLQDAYAVPAG